MTGLSIIGTRQENIAAKPNIHQICLFNSKDKRSFAIISVPS